MKKSVAKKWVKALRSGKYGQTSDVLCKENKETGECAFCCLGVLINEVASPENGTWETSSYGDGEFGTLTFHDETEFLPSKIAEYAGIDTSTGYVSLSSDSEGDMDKLEDLYHNEKLSYRAVNFIEKRIKDIESLGHTDFELTALNDSQKLDFNDISYFIEAFSDKL